MVTCSYGGCELRVLARGYCSKHYQLMRRRGNIVPRATRPSGLSLEDAFRWHMPGVPPSEGCWDWSGYRDEHGYGTMTFERKGLRANVVSYTIHSGPVPSGMMVLHSCDYPPCVSPFHLSLGTCQDNATDRKERGRQVRGKFQHLAKLNDDQVVAIRLLGRNGVVQEKIAELYGVGQSTISSILRRETWKHIP